MLPCYHEKHTSYIFESECNVNYFQHTSRARRNIKNSGNIGNITF